MYIVALVREDNTLNCIAPVDSVEKAEKLVDAYQNARNAGIAQGLVRRAAKEYRIVEVGIETPSVKTISAVNAEKSSQLN